MDFKSKKRGSQPSPNSYAVLFLIAAFGLFMGTVVVRKAMRYPGHHFPTGPIAFEWDDGPNKNDGRAGDPESEDACVPVLVRDETVPATTIATMVDKALDTSGRVTATDRTFSIEASAAVADLTLTFNPPIVVTPGAPVPIPQPNWTKTSVMTGGRIVCTVRKNGVCSPAVETPAGDIWSGTSGSASVAVRAEHEDIAPDEVRISFQLKSAIDGGAVTGAGPFLAPPPGSITYTNDKKTVSPALGSARWRCDWLL